MITTLAILGMTWVWIAYEIHVAPVIDDEKNKTKNENNK